MNKSAVLLLLLIGFVEGFSQDTKAFIKNLEANYVAVQLDTMLVNKCECSNGDYALFLGELRAKKDDQYFKYIPDSAGWTSKRFFDFDTQVTHAIMEYYHWHPAYVSYPVVNVSFDAALRYCEWLTGKYNSTAGRKYKKVVFRLPTKAEWERAAAARLDTLWPSQILPWSGVSFVDSKGQYRANFQPVEDFFIKRNEKGELILKTPLVGHAWYQDNAIVTVPCGKAIKKSDRFLPNDYGIFHMAGNVSEMLTERGRTKGGSFLSPGYYLLIQTDEDEFPQQELGGPSIGFRPFMFVVEK